MRLRATATAERGVERATRRTPLRCPLQPEGRWPGQGRARPRRSRRRLVGPQKLPTPKRPPEDLSRDVMGQLLDDPDVLRRSEEHTSELQSQSNLVCRLLLEKKKK